MDTPPAPSGSLLQRKYGPLPLWGWMGILLGVVLVWRMNASKKEKDAQDASTTITAGYTLPKNIPPQFTQVDASNTWINKNSNNQYGSNNTNPPAAPVDAPPPPAGKWVTVARWKGGQPSSTPSTLFNIAATELGKGELWTTIWNAPENASLVARRKNPTEIQAGDRFWVPLTTPSAPAGGDGDGMHMPSGGRPRSWPVYGGRDGDSPDRDDRGDHSHDDNRYDQHSSRPRRR